MEKNVLYKYQNCLKCIAYSPTCGKIEKKMHGEIATVPFDVIHIDHAGPMDKGVLIKKMCIFSYRCVHKICEIVRDENNQ